MAPYGVGRATHPQVGQLHDEEHIMSYKPILVVVSVVSVMTTGHAQGKDPRVQVITRTQLQRLLATTPIDSPLQSRIAARSYASGLIGAADIQYTQIWQRKKNNPYANFLRGSTALDYWWYASYPSTGIRLTATQNTRLFTTARVCLAQAVESKPDFARAVSSYGSFLFNYESNRSEGLTLMKKAVVLEPSNPALWESLGETYLAPVKETQSLSDAEKCLHRAAQLDPLYSAPHYTLIRLFSDQRRFKEARRELRVYCDLVSTKSAQTATALFKPQIDRGLGQK